MSTSVGKYVNRIHPIGQNGACLHKSCIDPILSQLSILCRRSIVLRKRSPTKTKSLFKFVLLVHTASVHTAYYRLVFVSPLDPSHINVRLLRPKRYLWSFSESYLLCLYRLLPFVWFPSSHLLVVWIILHCFLVVATSYHHHKRKPI